MIQKLKAIKTESGKLVNQESEGPCTTMFPVPMLDPCFDLDAAQQDLGEPCHLVDVIVLEKGEVPSKEDLLDADMFISLAFNRTIAGHEEREEALLNVKEMLRALAEVVGE